MMLLDLKRLENGSKYAKMFEKAHYLLQEHSGS